jgi:4-hydroxybenzoate polyprenyltransferase
MVRRWVSLLSTIGSDIKLSHSVFALPFALLGAFMASWHFGVPLRTTHLVLLVACMFFARTYAMLCNRLIDRRIDGANPRTAGRALPSGRLSGPEAVLALVVSAVGLVIGATGFGVAFGNWWPLVGSPIVLLWLGLYPLTKRFTAAAHFVLGAALAMSVGAAALAIEPAYLTAPAPWLLMLFVLLWVSGFDVIYALQDIDVDREQKLRSIPAWLGERGALMTAKLLHLGALGALVGVQRTCVALDQWFAWAIVAVAVLLVIEHRAASRGQFNTAFFTFNGIISLAVGTVGIVEILL